MKRCFVGKNANISVQNISRVSDSGVCTWINHCEKLKQTHINWNLVQFMQCCQNLFFATKFYIHTHHFG